MKGFSNFQRTSQHINLLFLLILQIDPQLLGKDATTQIRKGGRMQKKRKEAEATQQEIKQREELESKYSEWGKG